MDVTHLCAIVQPHNDFEMAKTDGYRLQCIISKPGKRGVMHNLRNITN